MTAEELVRAIRKDFTAARNPALAEPMAKYMRNLFPFLGLPAPKQSELLSPLLISAKPWIDEAFLQEASAGLWKRKEREFHHAGAAMLVKYAKHLTLANLPHVRSLIETNSWWDTVDTLSTRVVGPLVLRYPKLRGEMDAWSADENFWIRRCAIIHQMHHKDQTDTERLFEYCTTNAHDKEFFIRKAIGWALRQYARTDVRAVVRYVDAHPELSGLSRREALKHCS